MNELSYGDINLKSDRAIEKDIGVFIKKTRQSQRKTQDEVAKAANISRSTLSLLERGESGNLKTLIQVLRVLDQLHTLSGLKYEPVASPLAIAKDQLVPLKRIRKSAKDKDSSSTYTSDW